MTHLEVPQNIAVLVKFCIGIPIFRGAPIEALGVDETADNRKGLFLPEASR